MPYKAEKIKLPPELDRRRKLTLEVKEIIKQEYESGNFSQRGLAKKYGVDKKTISLIVNPQALEKERERTKNNWRNYRKTGEERNRIAREHRQYKVNLYRQGLLREEKQD